MKHYCSPLSRAAMSMWMFEELQVPHEQIVIDMEKGENRSPEYLAINPMGKVPALVDGDVVVTEAAAICTYLADRFPEKGLAPEPGSPERGAYYRYLFAPGTTFEPMFSLSALDIETPNPTSAGWGDEERVLSTIEAMAPAEGWALKQGFTTADLVFGGLLDFGMVFGWIDPTAKVAAYVDRIRERPAYRATHEAFIAAGFSFRPGG